MPKSRGKLVSPARQNYPDPKRRTFAARLDMQDLNTYFPARIAKQRFMIDGLDEMMIKAGLARTFQVSLLPVPGDRDHDDVRTSLSLAQHTNEFVSVHPRQANIHQDKIERRLIDDRQCFLAVLCAANLVPLETQNPGETACGIEIIVDHKNTSRRSVRPRLRNGAPAGTAVSGPWLTTGRRTLKVLPSPLPLLWAVTLPPCISTSRRTIVSPIPSPPSERAAERLP